MDRENDPASAALLAPLDALTRGFELPDLAQPASGVAVESTAELRQGFCVGDLALMIRYQDGSNLTDLPATRRLPNTPHWFVGMTNLNGALIPVFDLAAYLGADRSPPARPMLLVLGHGADAAGVVIDGLPQRLRFEATDRMLDAPIPAAFAGCVAATCWAAECNWMDLQVDALLQNLCDELAGAAS